MIYNKELEPSIHNIKRFGLPDNRFLRAPRRAERLGHLRSPGCVGTLQINKYFFYDKTTFKVNYMVLMVGKSTFFANAERIR